MNKNTENKKCEEICIKYINTKNYYNKLIPNTIHHIGSTGCLGTV